MFETIIKNEGIIFPLKTIYNDINEWSQHNYLDEISIVGTDTVWG